MKITSGFQNLRVSENAEEMFGIGANSGHARVRNGRLGCTLDAGVTSARSDVRRAPSLS